MPVARHQGNERTNVGHDSPAIATVRWASTSPPSRSTDVFGLDDSGVAQQHTREMLCCTPVLSNSYLPASRPKKSPKNDRRVGCGTSSSRAPGLVLSVPSLRTAGLLLHAIDIASCRRLSRCEGQEQLRRSRISRNPQCTPFRAGHKSQNDNARPHPHSPGASNVPHIDVSAAQG